MAFALPSRCFGCEARLGPDQHLGACLNCWSAFRVLVPPLCDLCGQPRPPATDLLGPARGRCAACLIEHRAADAVRGAVAYDGLARRFLLRAKLGGRRELFGPLARHLVQVLRVSSIADGCSLVVPVPSHPLAVLRRGFSPAREFAIPVSRVLGLPHRPRVLAVRLLSRQSSKRLPARLRFPAARAAFRARGRLAGQRVLLVDDVMTTGASVEACARALKRAGCPEVRVLVWARTP